jgi:dolichyl-phosphate-mannose--protein O-mannosyl transferase
MCLRDQVERRLVCDRVRRDWRAGAVLFGVAAGWLPWLWFYWHDQRTEFCYHAVAFGPFLMIAITLCLGLILGPGRAGPPAGRRGGGRRLPARGRRRLL